MVNEEWHSLFPNACLNNLVAATSGHSPIKLTTITHAPFRRKHRFRFENSWLLEETLNEAVRKIWDTRDHQNATEKLRKCSAFLSKWGHGVANRFKDKITQQKMKIDYYRGSTNPEDVQTLKTHKEGLSKLLEQEEIHYK